MRKHFLLLFLLTLLPLSGWATDFSDSKVTITVNNQPFNTALTTIEAGISVKIDGTPLVNTVTEAGVNQHDKWTWDQKFYTDANGSASATVATGNTTPNVATYYIKITAVEGSGNSGSKFAPLIIEPAALVASVTSDGSTTLNDYTAPVAKPSLTYNGKQQKLIEKGNINTTGTGATGSTAKCGSFTYALGVKKEDGSFTDEGCTYGTDLPQGTKAGTYKVYWILSGSKNYAEAKGSVDVTIAGKAIKDLTTTPTTDPAWKMTAAASYTYTGNAQAPTFVVKDGTTDITEYVDVVWYPATASTSDNVTTYTKTEGATAVDGTPVGAGTYIAYLKGKEGSNYAATEFTKADKSWGYTIAKKVIQIKIVNLSSTYDGKPVTLDKAQIIYPGLCPADAEASVTNFDGNIKVQFADQSNYSTNGPTNVNRDGEKKVIGYDLSIKLESEFNTTSLFKNYQIMYTASDATEATASDINDETIASVTGTYTINPVAISIKPRTIEMEYGATAPTAPTAATVDAAATESTPAVKGTVEITKGAMVVVNETPEDFLAALKFTVAPKAKDAVMNAETEVSPATEWKDAVMDTYAGKLTLKLKEAVTHTEGGYGDGDDPEGNPGVQDEGDAALTAALAVANNYDIDFVPGDVKVIGQALTVYAIGGNVEYGSDPADWKFTYEANGLKLNGTPEYEIYDLKGNKIEDSKLVNLPRGTYQVKMVENEDLNPANYTIKTWEPGFLVVTKKKITITINPLIVNPGTSVKTLNDNASVKAYADLLVGDDTYLTYKYSFNGTATKTGDASNTALSTLLEPSGTNNGGLKTNADGVFENGITASIITWDETKTDAVNLAAGAVKANANYEVTFEGGDLTIVGPNSLYLAQADEYLLDKIKEAANKSAASTSTTYNILFDDRELKREVWAAMVLPFETSVKEISDALNYAVVDVLDVDNKSNDMHLKLHMGKIAANQPFIVKYYKEDVEDNASTTDVDESVDNSKLKLSTLRNLPRKKIVYKADAAYVNDKGNVFVENTYNGHQFIGVYNPVDVYGANYKWIARGNGNLLDAGDYTEDNKAHMRRLISYFKLNPSAQNARILIDEPDGTTTVINAITAESMNVQAEGWYTLNGVKLQGVPTEKGIYINNGKKVVIK